MSMIRSQLRQWHITNKRVFLRADLNVPIAYGTINNDFKLTSMLPTLDFLLTTNNMVILATHIGEPDGYDPELSTQLLIPWFKQRNYLITFAKTPQDAAKQPMAPRSIVLLENLRFFPQEKATDPFFAKELAQTAHYFVNDAFGTLHRNDCSITQLPYEFDEHKRTIGFLVEKELQAFDQIMHNPHRPFLAILGGKKIESKIPLISGLIEIADEIIVCPALCFSFLAAQGYNLGTSLINQTIFAACSHIEHAAKLHNVDLMFPIDYQVTNTTIDGELSYCSITEFTNTTMGIAIGPRSVEQFSHTIAQAGTIFFNCAMGFSDNPATQKSTCDLLHALASSSAKTIVAGGDTVAMVFQAGLEHHIDHISTGGGAALAYISNNQLPGLMPFEES